MDIQATKLELIHWLTQIQDMTVLEKLQLFKKGQGNPDLSLEQQLELDERLAK